MFYKEHASLLGIAIILLSLTFLVVFFYILTIFVASPLSVICFKRQFNEPRNTKKVENRTSLGGHFELFQLREYPLAEPKANHVCRLAGAVCCVIL